MLLLPVIIVAAIAVLLYQRAKHREHEATGTPFPAEQTPSRGDRDARASLLTILIGVPLSLIAASFWALAVNTASMGGPESDLVQGSAGVLRNIPATILLLAVPITGFAFAARAARQSARNANLAVWACTIGLLLVLVVIAGSTVDSMMTRRDATVKWMLFPLEIAIAAAAQLIARFFARHPRSDHSKTDHDHTSAM